MLRVTDDAPRASIRPDASTPETLLTDLHLLGAIARRAHRRLQHGGGLLPPERERAWRLFDQVQTDFRDLQQRDPADRPGPADLPRRGQDVLSSGSATVPRIERPEKAEPYRDQILAWVDRCRGNLVRVHEELVAQGVAIS